MALKVLYLTKRRDACWTVRCQMPMSQLNSRGHSCDDEIFEQRVVCQQCARTVPNYSPSIINWDHEESAVCAGCQAEVIPEAEVKEWRENILRLISEKDLIVFQRPTDLSHLRLMKLAKKQGKKLVQTADDDYINVPEWNTGYKYYGDRKAIIEETFRTVDAFDVTTPGLKELYSKYCPNIRVLPNCQDIELIDVTPAMRDMSVFSKTGSRVPTDMFMEMRQNNKLILWGGSPTHEKDLELIVGAARRLSRSEKVLFAFVGYVHRGLVEMIPADRIFLFSLVPCVQYFMLYKGINADIGLAPVVDVPFNTLGKSSNKAVEYQILRALPVMSDLPTYQGCSPCGIYSKNTEYDWYRSMQRAANMPDEERSLAVEENRKFVEDNFDIKKKVVNWESFYGEILG